MILIFILLIVIMIAAQPTIVYEPLTVTEMLEYPNEEKCSQATITRFEILRPIGDEFVMVVFDGVICGDEKISINNEELGND